LLPDRGAGERSAAPGFSRDTEGLVTYTTPSSYANNSPCQGRKNPSLIREGWGGFVALTNPIALRALPLVRGRNKFLRYQPPLVLQNNSPYQGRKIDFTLIKKRP